MSDIPVVNDQPERRCTCHPDDNPPVPCQKQYALSDCRNVAQITRLRAEVERLTKDRDTYRAALTDIAWGDFGGAEGMSDRAIHALKEAKE